MQEIRDALMRIVNACRMEEKISTLMAEMGYTDNVHSDVWSELADAVFCLIGEAPTDNFRQTVTFMALKSFADPESKVEMLMAEYRKNHATTVQPAPNCISRKEMEEMVNRNGGYISKEPI